MNTPCHLKVAVVLMLSVTMVMSDNFNSVSNEIPDSSFTPRDRVCEGLTNGMGLSGTYAQWYRLMNETYYNCTYVNGDLLISWFQDGDIDYDFNFLRSIRYVRGHVIIIASAPVVELPLVNLEIIRGNTTYQRDGVSYGLIIGITNFTTIRLPKLIEISNGGVLTTRNAPYQHIELSRSWDNILGGRARSNPELLNLQNGNDMGENTPHWFSMCADRCPHRCFLSGVGGCCHSQCAGGCYGARSDQCLECKDYNMNGNCVSHCSDPYYAIGSQCLYNTYNFPLPRPRRFRGRHSLRSARRSSRRHEFENPQ